ncbi:MAG: hypothetical protein WCS42_13550 [Verrucomicrobiota bacterium]
MIEYILSSVVPFLLGVISSIMASVIYEHYKAKKSIKPLRFLSGYWLETMPASEAGRNYSIGKFQYNRHTRTYTFDGTNYRNDGEAFCTWESTYVYSDLKNRKIYYIFRASLKDARHAENYGFGVINIVENESGVPIPTSGYYIETKEDAKPYSHSMERLEKVAMDLNVKHGKESVGSFHSQLIKKLHARQESLKIGS